MKKAFLKYLKNKFVIAGLTVVALIALFVVYKSATKPPNFDSAEVKIGDVVETVSVTGTISPVDKADLAFEKSGVLARVYVKVGDAVKRGQTIAVLSGGNERAALSGAEATLADMSRALTPEEQAVQKSALDAASAALEIAKKDALNSAYGGYVKAGSALGNYTDGFFANPSSVNPTINLPTDSSNQESNINRERVAVTNELSKWSAEMSAATDSSAEDLVSKSKMHLAVIKNFMADLSSIVDKLIPAGSGLTQARIDADVSAMNSALSALDSAASTIESARSSIVSAQNSYEQARSSYNLKLAGNSADAIAAQSAKVAAAMAALNQGVIISPINGIVTKAEPMEGEFVAAGTAGFAVQNNNFKIEANVPEADIAKIVLDNMASSTLDAYGSDADFPASVVAIDPAETVIEGVPTYKVTLEFINADSRIRSGMTANLIIQTHRVSGVLVVPSRSITDDNGEKSVKKVDQNGKTYTKAIVAVGLKGSDGNIQILSGLKVGDKIVTYIKQ